MFPSVFDQKMATKRGTGGVVPSLLGLSEIPQDPLGLVGSIQLAGESKLLQVDHAAQGLNEMYVQLKPEWDVLKESVDMLLKDLDFLLPRYFEEIDQREKGLSIPSAEDVIKSFQRLGTSDRVGRQPLHQFVSLLKSLKNVLPFVKQVKDVLSYFDFKRSLVDSLTKMENIAQGKRANDTVHPEVLNITKDLKLVKTDIYLPLISTVPSLLDNINTVKETLKNELSSMGIGNIIGDEILGVPIMLQAARTPDLNEVDGQVINMYRKLSRGLEEERRLLLQENQLKTKMLLDKFSIPQTPDGGELDHDIGNGTLLKRLLRIFDRKVSMSKLKDVIRINFTTSIFAAGIFDSKGGNLTIKNAGINLFIPSGAIPPRTRKEIYIYLDADAHLNLENKEETRIAPIIHCGPPGTSFEEPFVLSFPHTAENEDKWSFAGLIQDTVDPDDHWKIIGDDCDGICFVEGGYCTIMVNHFTNFTATGIAQTEGSKRMNICTFGKCYNRSRSYAFNVHAFNTYDTDAVIKEHGGLTETRLDTVKTFRVQNNGKDVSINVNKLKKGWSSEYDSEMTMGHDNLWYEQEVGCKSPCCLFRLKTEDPQCLDSVYCRMKVKQDGNTEETFLEIDPIASPTHQFATVSFADEEINVDASRRMYGFTDDAKLPEAVCHDLYLHLDIERDGMEDWRALAVAFKLNSKLIEKIQTFQHPTQYLLSIVRPRYKSEDFCAVLFDKLKEAKLGKAAKMIRPYVTRD